MVSEKAKAYLREKYGEKYFGWDIEDHHLKEIITESNPSSYEELDEKCSALENTIRAIESMLERMYGARKTGNTED